MQGTITSDPLHTLRFVAHRCLVKDSRSRPNIDAVAQHPFLKTHLDTSLSDLLKWAQGTGP